MKEKDDSKAVFHVAVEELAPVSWVAAMAAIPSVPVVLPIVKRSRAQVEALFDSGSRGL